MSALAPIASSCALTLAQGSASALVILSLSAAAGIGTVLLLPSRRERALSSIGGTIVVATGLIGMALIARVTAQHAGADVYFWIFATIAILGAFRVISHPKPVYSALYFVLTVMASAGLFVLLWAEFIAAALVLIYAGAILITYVFVIMLASQAHPEGNGGAEYDQTSREPARAAAVGFLLMGVILFVIFDKSESLPPPGADGPTGTVREVGEYLFQHQALNLELSGVVLTLAMVGAIVIARKQVPSETPVLSDDLTGPATPISDDPHSIPVYGTNNPRAKAFPEK